MTQDEAMKKWGYVWQTDATPNFEGTDYKTTLVAPAWLQAQHPGQYPNGFDANGNPIWGNVDYSDAAGGMGPLLIAAAALSANPGLLAGLGGGTAAGEAATLGSLAPEAVAGADILTGGLGSAATGLEGFGLGATGTAGTTGGLSSLATSGGGNMDFMQALEDWSTLGNASGDVTSQIANLQAAVENGSMSLQDAMAQMQAVNNAASGGTWADYLSTGAFPSEAASSVANFGLPEWAKGLPESVKKLLAPSSGAGATGGKTSTGIGWLDSLLGGGISGQTVGAGLSALLGYKASQDQTKALTDQANRFAEMGAPYRQKLSDLYANPDSFLRSEAVQRPVQQGTDMLMRSLSTQGNPWGSGNALQQGQDYATNKLAGLLGQEKDRLAGFGGLSSYNQAAPQASNEAIKSSANAWNALGSGAANIFNPPETQAQTMANWAKIMRGGM